VQRILIDPSTTLLLGIVSQCILHGLIVFHSRMSLPRDIMYDLFEGVCSIVIVAMLKQASSVRLLAHDEIPACSSTHLISRV
jgi:hypothetical protein